MVDLVSRSPVLPLAELAHTHGRQATAMLSASSHSAGVLEEREAATSAGVREEQ